MQSLSFVFFKLMIKLGRLKKSLAITLLTLLVGVGFYFANKSILETKDIDSQIHKIEALRNLQVFATEVVNPREMPFKAGSLKKDKSAYFSIQFEFYVSNYSKNPENLFQTGSFNSGIRVEQYGKSLSIIYSDAIGKGQYSIIELTNNLKQGKLYSLKIQALTKEFLRINFNGEITTIKSPTLVFSTQDFLIGGGFDDQRNYSGELINVVLKKTNYHSLIASALRKYPKDVGEALSFISQIGIFLAALIFLAIRKLRISHFYTINKSYKFLLLLIFAQVVLLIYFPFYRFVILGYLFLYTLGFPFQSHLIPKYFNSDKYLWVFSPLVGLGILSLVGAYFISFNMQIKLLVILPLLSILGWAFFQRNSLVAVFKEMIDIKNLLFDRIHDVFMYLTLCITPIIFILSYPALSIDGLTTPVRVGPDAALYASMSQYLLDGGTWFEANLRAQQFLGMTAGEITRYTNATMSWPFMYFYRWGLATFQSVFLLINGLDHIYRVLFTSLILPYLLTGGIVYYWLRERFQLSVFIAVSGAIGFIFNANLLNLWFEGFYGNAFSLCFYAFLYLAIDAYSADQKIALKERSGHLILIVFIFSVILVSYGEGLIFVLPPLIAMHFLCNLIIYKHINVRLYAYLLGGMLIAIIILLPCRFLVDWIILSIKQITEEGGNGYPQPYWALANEILGLNNLYAQVERFNGGIAFTRSHFNSVIAVSSTLLVLGVLFWYFFREKIRSTFGLSAYLLIGAFGLYIYKTSPMNNYGFMKMYIFILPILFVYFWATLSLIASKSKYRIFLANPKMLIASFVVLITLNGLSYILSYEKNSTKIPVSYFKDHEIFKDINLDNAVIYSLAKTKFPFILPAIIPGEWVTYAWDGKNFKTDQYFQKYLNRKIFLLYEGVCDIDGADSPPLNQILTGQTFSLIDSNLFVSDLLEEGVFSASKLQNLKMTEFCKKMQAENQ